MTDREPSQLVSEAADNLRIFNHQTRTEQLTDRCIIARTPTQSSGRPPSLAYSLPQALSQLSDALRRSLAVFDIYDQDRDPADSVTIATHAISAAADAFTQAAQHLSDAQAAIAHQGVNEVSAGNLRLATHTPASPQWTRLRLTLTAKVLLITVRQRNPRPAGKGRRSAQSITKTSHWPRVGTRYKPRVAT